jgi:hypothetical protein
MGKEEGGEPLLVHATQEEQGFFLIYALIKPNYILLMNGANATEVSCLSNCLDNKKSQ